MPSRKRFILPAVSMTCIVAAVVWITLSVRRPQPAQLPQATVPVNLDQADPLLAEMIQQAIGHVNENRGEARRWLLLGMVYHANDYLELAEQCYRKGIELDDTLFTDWYLLALLQARLGRYETAIEQMRRAVELDPSYAPAYWRIGQWYLDVGDLDLAHDWFVRCTEMDPADDGGWIGLVRVRLQRNEPDLAVQLIQQRLLQGRNDGYARHLLAAAYRSLQRPEEARIEAARGRSARPILPDTLRSAMTRYKTGYEAMIDRSNKQIAAGRFQEAIRLLEQLREDWLDDPGILNNLALAYLHSGQFDHAVSLLRSSLTISPDLHTTHINLALAYEKQSAATGTGLDSALEHAQRALNLKPTDSETHEMKAFLHVKRGEYSQAINSYRTAIEHDPGNSRLLINLARTLQKEQRYDEAAATFERAVEVDPSDLTAYVGLAVTKMDAGMLDRAEAVLEQAVRLAAPNHPAIRQARARLLRLRPTVPFEDGESHKREFLAIAQRLQSSNNQYLGRGDIRSLQRELAQANLPAARRVKLEASLSLELLQHGDVEGAMRLVENAFRTADAAPQLKDGVPDLYRLRALLYLRQAEINNCVLRRNADCCVLPLQRGGIHVLQVPAQQSRLNYERFLQFKPDNLTAKWLLNIANMALGEYPHGVPEQHRIPPQAFDSDYDIGRFVDVAGDLGINTFNLCGGCIVDDFDNDGFLDVITTTWDMQGPAAFYRNLGNGQFEDASATSRIDDQLGGLNCIGTDYDNDGDVDVLILRGAWLFDDGRIRNSLMRNNGDGTFTDVTYRAGLTEPPSPTQAAVWGDFDNDGDLDLYIGNESRADAAMFSPAQARGGNYPSELFRNNGDGTFTDIASSAGVTNDRYCKGVAAGDYDNDGDLDLYLSNIGRNRLYRNNGDGTFTDVAEQLGVTAPENRSFPTWFFDYDNDGWLDLFVAAFDASISDVALDYLGRPHNATAPCLYRNTGGSGSPGFTNVTKQLGLDHPYLPMGANFGDLDNDGFLDIYLGTGEPDYQALMPNIMLRNDRGQRFQDVTMSGGFGHLQKGHGIAFADIDHDGDQDIYHQVGGMNLGDEFYNALFLNPGHGNHWLTINLVGTETNRAGVGVRIKVTVQTPRGRREIHRAAGCVSSFGGSPRRQEIGLGNATRIEQLEIHWPTSDRRQTFTDVPLDVMITVVEDQDDFEIVPLKTFSLLPSAGP